ncbi:glycosyltransferase family 39 protein [Acidithiobacillus sulfurivorans]|uniref:Glycosyltransferase family 39 protein n=1 Tax=Acidithiobacillus sulfurivorans TaxID=1958756 RepID=A0ABS5ZYX3_9PROT|nr:glycosyltransferase family 39 protein [Acidithiobacillus sulfurivorans]MBU2760427.1 glycosyltransferase family 39 protein [Acidithiobacillus sulfurivorans]
MNLIKTKPVDQIVITFLFTIWAGIWLSQYFFIPNATYDQIPNIMQSLIHWDAGWYMDIVQHGYSYNGNPNDQQNIAFFPLYPIIMKVLEQLFGLQNGVATIFPALLFGVASIYAFHALARTRLNENASLFATAAYALYPGATFFVSAYPTSIMNLLVIITFLAFNKKRYFIAAIAAGISTAGGALLVFLSATITLAYANKIIFKENKLTTSKFFQLILFAFVSFSGIIVFMLYQQISFGNALAFIDVQKAWGYKSITERIINLITLSPIFGGGYGSFFRSILFLQPTGKSPEGSVEYITNTFSIIMAIFSTWILYKFKEYLFFIYSLLVVLGYIWFIGSVQGPSSTFRLLYIDIPIFIAAGIYFQNSDKKVLCFLLLAFSALALLIQTAFFASGYWVI